ncbi:hypothetical protein HY78_17890 [Rhizorhabdus wittichii DC-6]|nr:hypothetical protein HY78_17890 [Rhizorhabdus wittichii DC-6]
MAKLFNGIFRHWMKVRQPDPEAPPVIWGHCVVHLSHPEFSGNVLHTSGVLDISMHKAVRIAETRNNYYALLGPELVMPANGDVDPRSYLERRRKGRAQTDEHASAAVTAHPDCPKCLGTGTYRYGERRLAICDLCCRHNRGWWQLEGAYGADNGRWACKAGCGLVLDTPPSELEFLPRAIAGVR